MRRMSPDSTPQLLTDQDLYLFNEGSHYRLYDKMGAHLATHGYLTPSVSAPTLEVTK